MTDKMQTVTLIGAGSIGSITALLLALIARNIPLRFLIYDFDTVALHNPINQLYRNKDIGSEDTPVYKVAALQKILQDFSSAEIIVCQENVGPETILGGIVVVMVDSMRERKSIFAASRYNAVIPLYIDARSGGKFAVIYGLDPRDPDDITLYEKTLYSDEKASPAPCADARTIPTLFAIASVIARIINEFLEKELKRFSESLINYQSMPIIQSGINK